MELGKTCQLYKNIYGRPNPNQSYLISKANVNCYENSKYIFENRGKSKFRELSSEP